MSTAYTHERAHGSQPSTLHDRYPGARSFTSDPEDRRLFFGREREATTLFHQVLSARLVVVYGKSGLGKTSLLQAGVLPRLQEQDFLPLPVRLNELTLPPLELVLVGIKDACQAAGIDYRPGDTSSLWDFFHTAVFWRGDALQTPVLVFDQFEELFTLQSAESRRVLAELLGELVGGGIPHAVRMGAKRGEKLPYGERPPELKVIVSLREEYFGALQELTVGIPQILENRFRLTPLIRDEARRAIEEPPRLADNAERLSTRAFAFAAEATDAMLDFLESKTGEIESFQLQLLCRHVEGRVRQEQAAGKTDITVDSSYLGDRSVMQAMLQGFYRDVIADLPKKKAQRTARRLCEVGLLSPEGRRLSLEQGQIARDYKVEEAELNRLVDARLLRREPRLDSFYYELSHDSLAQPVMDNRPLRLSKRMTISLIGLVVVFGLLAVGLFQWQRQKAQSAEIRAQLAQKVIERAPYILPEMVRIEAGSFDMGSPKDEANRSPDEGPRHQVTIKRSFWLGKYEVTFDEYDRFAKDTKRNFPIDRSWGRGNRPVIYVSWEDATAYATWLSEKTGERYRLPTEAEWEYAARTGSMTAYSFGDDPAQLDTYAWYAKNSGGKTHPVGQLKPNTWGLYDMYGNVWEWVQDWYGDYPTGAVVDPTGSTEGEYRVLHGGSWINNGRFLRSAYRNAYDSGNRSGILGFRLARGQVLNE